jgi:hypothetical protein
VTIHEFRLSLIFGETVPAPVVDQLDAGDLPRPYVVRREEYEGHFDRASQGDPAPPWPQHVKHGFWTPYLEASGSLLEVGGGRAFKALVPLRVRSPLSLTAPVPESRVSGEGFLYPWGAAFVLTVASHHPWTDLLQPARAAHELRRTGRFQISDNCPLQPLPVEDVASRALAELRRQTFGDLPAQRWLAEPFSVHAVVRGAADRVALTPDREEVHRFLHAVTSFSRTWETDALPPVVDMKVAGRKTQPPDHIVYGRRRGRAIWAPDHFTRGSGPVHSIGCHHRNLVLASLQTEALVAFTQLTAERLRSGHPLNPAHRVIAKRAANTLGRMYRGRGSYRSGSVKAQIERNEWLTDINQVSRELELTQIGPPPAGDHS